MNLKERLVEVAEVWRCDLKHPCVQFCNSNPKQCGTLVKDKRNKMNLKQSSLEVGKSKSYFCVMKRTNPIIFRFQTIYGQGNLISGYYKWEQYVSGITSRVEDIYYSFPIESDFARWLHRNEICSTKDVAIGFARRIFLNIEKINIRRVKKFKKIIQLYEKEINQNML